VQLGVEGGHLIHGREHERIGLLKCTEAVEQLTVSDHRPGDLRGGQAAAIFNLPDRLGLEFGAM